MATRATTAGKAVLLTSTVTARPFEGRTLQGTCSQRFCLHGSGFGGGAGFFAHR